MTNFDSPDGSIHISKDKGALHLGIREDCAICAQISKRHVARNRERRGHGDYRDLITNAYKENGSQDHSLSK